MTQSHTIGYWTLIVFSRISAVYFLLVTLLGLLMFSRIENLLTPNRELPQTVALIIIIAFPRVWYTKWSIYRLVQLFAIMAFLATIVGMYDSLMWYQGPQWSTFILRLIKCLTFSVMWVEARVRGKAN
jgi:hypothetical protein